MSTITPSQADPFDDFRALIASMPAPDQAAREAVRARRARLAVPPGGLGQLGELVDWLAAVTGRNPPTFRAPRLALYAGRHGAAHRDPLSPDAAHVRAHLELLAAGGGAANALCAAGDVGLQVFDLAPETPPGDPADGPAMSARDCAATLAFGMEALAGEVDLLCLGDIASGAGFGAGAILDPVAIPAAWAARHGAHREDPLDWMARVGGREIAALAGAILAAGHQRVPVILDGLAALAAAATLARVNPDAIAHCRLAEARGADHARFAQSLGLRPILDLELSVGEGAAAALAVQVVRTALSVDLAIIERARAAPAH